MGQAGPRGGPDAAVKVQRPISGAAVLALMAIGGYRCLISPMLAPTCRFRPTCSEYAEEAIRRFGFIHGGWMACWRLLRCHPLHAGGWDPVPERKGG